MKIVRTKVTSNGQVSLPAELRHRWRAPAVLVIDKSGYAIVRPIPDDPVAALRGSHAGTGPATDHARAADDVEADLALLCHDGMEVATLDATTATLAGRLRARHYHRERCAVSLADCVASAVAIMHDRPLATADPALADLLRAEHGKIVGLPDSSGRRP